MMALSRERVTSGSQARFFGLLVVFSLVFALGFSIALFGAGTDFLATARDQVVLVGIGVGMMALGAVGAYWTLS